MNDSSRRREHDRLTRLNATNREKKLRAEKVRAESLASNPESHNEHPISWKSMSRSDRRTWRAVAKIRAQNKAAAEAAAEAAAKLEAAEADEKSGLAKAMASEARLVAAAIAKEVA